MTDSEFCAECEKRVEKIGRPEWEEEETGIRWMLDGLIACIPEGDAYHDLTDHEAVCIWERHVREWLERRDFWVEPVRGLVAMRYRIPAIDLQQYYDDPRAALLAAVDAVEENK